MPYTIREGLTFDDVLLEPAHSPVPSRSDVELSCGFIDPDLQFEHPIIPANMLDIAGTELLSVQADSGGLCLIHRFQSVEDQRIQFSELGRDETLVGASIGVGEEDYTRATELIKEGVRIICVDIAHGDSYLAERMVHLLRNSGYPSNLTVIAGNVATAGGARRLWQAGADVVKVGVGPGSLCTTRIETGCGVPQLTALMDISAIRDEFFPYKGIIADGGIRSGGDCVKALCFSDMVMVGNLVAGCDEAPGERLDKGYRGIYKKYRGSSTHKTTHVEGVEAWVEPSGPYKEILDRLLGGITSGCSYLGCLRLHELREDPRLIRITNAGLRESYPHDVFVVRDGQKTHPLLA